MAASALGKDVLWRDSDEAFEDTATLLIRERAAEETEGLDKAAGQRSSARGPRIDDATPFSIARSNADWLMRERGQVAYLPRYLTILISSQVHEAHLVLRSEHIVRVMHIRWTRGDKDILKLDSQPNVFVV